VNQLLSHGRSNEADFGIGSDLVQALYFWSSLVWVRRDIGVDFITIIIWSKHAMFPYMRLSVFVLSISFGMAICASETPAKPSHTPRHAVYVETLDQVPLVNKANVGGQKVDMAQFGNWDNVEGERPFKFASRDADDLLLRTLFLVHYYDTGRFVISKS
jgi:hypothetical protein